MTIPKRTERSKLLILNAADAAFRDIGFADTSVEEIANRAGLTRKTVYNLFASKDDIALQLIARAEADDTTYRALMASGKGVIPLLERVLLDSAHWCLANPSIAKLALAPIERPSLEPPADRPSFQRLVRDILVLGQEQGTIRNDNEPNFMTLVLLSVYGQAMLSVLSGRQFDRDEIIKLVRIVIEGIGVRARQ
jgi:TetR/AcrR family transcriptional regulator of autoinduction and epiphytic fitness